MTQVFAYRPVAMRSVIGDYYLIALAALLIGYAIFGKTFAYVGIPPLYVGEAVFALGIIAFIFSRCAIGSFAALPNLLLAVLLGWAIIRTVPYIGDEGIDALRDSMIVVYGGFAFIATALLLEKPERLQLVIKFLRIVALIVVPLAPILVLLSNASSHSMTGEGQVTSEWSWAQVKIGTTGVHVAGAALLVFLGFQRAGIIWLGLLVIAMGVVGSLNRGGLLVIIFMLTFASIASGRLRELGVVVLIAVALIGTAFTFDLSIPTPRAERDVSAEQLVDNVGSIFGAGNSQDLDGTKSWRLSWWNEIIDYTVNGPYFWSGKGFGVDLGADDGTIHVSPSNPVFPTRSPHSAHFTMLARAGVPGLALWLLTLACWSAVVFTNMVHARLRGNNAWADFFLLNLCYVFGFIVDASFDVTLEGPMAGIWFWSAFGVGVGASMIYRAERAGVGLPHEELHARPDVSWPKMKPHSNTPQLP